MKQCFVLILNETQRLEGIVHLKIKKCYCHFTVMCNVYMTQHKRRWDQICLDTSVFHKNFIFNLQRNVIHTGLE